MATITDGFASAFRDYVTDGLPASGPHDPVKSEIRAIGPMIESALGTLSLGSVAVTKDTRAHLDADLAYAADSTGLVYADSTDANNDLYVKVGASGTGSWTLTTTLHGIVAAVAAGSIAAAQDAATAAAKSAALAEGFSLYTDLTSFTGMADGDETTVSASDTGTHTSITGDVILPLTSGTLSPNGGKYRYSASLSAWVRFAALDSQTASGFATAAGVSAGNAATSEGNAAASAAGAAGAAAAATAPVSEALTGFSAALETLGVSPSAGTAPLANTLYFLIGATASQDSHLTSVSAYVGTVGDGTARFVIAVDNPASGSTKTHIVGEMLIAGISATGVATFTPASPIFVPAGAIFALGSATGGAIFHTTVTSGTGASVPAAAGGYLTTKSVTGNYLGKFEVVLDPVVTVASAIAENATVAAQMPDSVVNEYVGSDTLLFESTGDQSSYYPIGNNIPFYSDGQLIGVQYCGLIAGAVDFHVYRGTARIGGYTDTITVGDGLTSTCPAPFPVKAGDKLLIDQRIGAMKTKGWSTQPGVYPSTSFDFSNTSMTSITKQIAARAIVQRPKRAREVAADAARGSTLTIDQHFRGASLPTGWTASGASWAAQNPGLTWTGSATANWDRWYAFNVPTAAQRRSITTEIYMGSADNILGLCSLQQSAATPMGSIIHIDGPANKGRVYQWDGAGTTVNAGLEVVLPWTVTATDVITINVKIKRGYMVVTFANAKTGQNATISSVYSSFQVYGGLMLGQLGAHFYSGSGGAIWHRISNRTMVSKTGPRKFWYGDSTHHLSGGTGDNFDHVWVNQVEDAYGHGGFINFARASTSANLILATLAQDFTALVTADASDVEVFWAAGVNPDNDLGTTDAQRYSAYKTHSQACFAIFEAAGAKVTIVTPTPSNSLPTYNALLIANLLAGDMGDYPVIDVGRAVSVSGDGATWITGLSHEGLHPCTFTGAPLVRDNFLAQRPDMNGAV